MNEFRPMDKGIALQGEGDYEIRGNNFSTREKAMEWIQPKLDLGYRLLDCTKVSETEGWTVAANR